MKTLSAPAIYPNYCLAPSPGAPGSWGFLLSLYASVAFLISAICEIFRRSGEAGWLNLFLYFSYLRALRVPTRRDPDKLFLFQLNLRNQRLSLLYFLPKPQASLPPKIAQIPLDHWGPLRLA